MGMKLKGKLTISRVSNDQDDDSRIIRIRVKDGLSGIDFATVEVSPKELALALTGVAYIDCDIELKRLSKVGMTAETKTEIVPFIRNHPTNLADMAAMAALEVEGWKARERDAENPHNWRLGGVQVIFSRHTGESVVEAESKQDT